MCLAYRLLSRTGQKSQSLVHTTIQWRRTVGVGMHDRGSNVRESKSLPQSRSETHFGHRETEQDRCMQFFCFRETDSLAPGDSKPYSSDCHFVVYNTMKIVHLLLSFFWSALPICSGSALEENYGVPAETAENLPPTTTTALSEEKGEDRYASKCSVMYR